MVCWIKQIFLCSGCALFVLASGCTSVNPDFKKDRPHHTAGGFRNLPGGIEKPGFLDFLKWQGQRFGQGVLIQDPGRVPRRLLRQEDVQWSRSESVMAWLGHSTVFLQLNGKTVLIDPVLSDRASPVSWAGPSRWVDAPIRVTDLPRIDLVLISHNHYDHLDQFTIRALAAQSGGPPLFLVPLGVDALLRRWGIENLRPMDWGDRQLASDLASDIEIEFVPAHHWSRRTLWDTNASLWGGFRIQTSKLTILYTGDTGYSTIYQDRALFRRPIDWLILPVGCYEPRWFMQAQHINPEEAQRIVRDLDAQRALGVHWGVFRLCDDGIDKPLDDLREVQKNLRPQETRIELWAVGEFQRLKESRSVGHE